MLQSIIKILSDYRRGLYGNWIYCPLVYTIRNYTLRITDTHSLLQVPLAVP
jgi:hypothetical protein